MIVRIVNNYDVTAVAMITIAIQYGQNFRYSRILRENKLSYPPFLFIKRFLSKN